MKSNLKIHLGNVRVSLNERKEEIVEVKVSYAESEDAPLKLPKNVQKLDLVGCCSLKFGHCHEPIRVPIGFVQVTIRRCKKGEMFSPLPLKLYKLDTILQFRVDLCRIVTVS